MAMFVLPAAIRAGNNGINRLSHNALHSRRQAWFLQSWSTGSFLYVCEV